MVAIRFLARAGQMCSDWYREFFLLSNMLGVSMLVDTINSSHFGTRRRMLVNLWPASRIDELMPWAWAAAVRPNDKLVA